MLAHYANTGMDTLSLFIDSSIDNVLFRTNPGLTMQSLLEFINIPERHLAETLLQDSQFVINWLLGRTDLDRCNLLTFFIHFNTYYAWSDFPR